MKVIINETYEQLSEKAAEEVARLMQGREKPVLCAASGDTPAGLYHALVKKITTDKLDTSNWSFVGLDEWMGMNGKDPGSCRYTLDQQLFGPLSIPSSRISFFDGRSSAPALECETVERFISEIGGIDVAILGLGMNGHIGMNEPGTSIQARSHISVLDPLTQQVGQKYFRSEQVLSQGITLGLGTLLESRNIILLISGAHKAAIAARVLEGPVTEKVPGSLLREHPGLTVYLDQAAASQLTTSRHE